MPVGANIRIAPAAGEPAALPSGEAAAVEELFGEIIASVGDPTAEAPQLAAGVEAEAPVQAPTAKGEEMPETVAQLLALATAQQAAAPVPNAPAMPAETTEAQPEAAEAQVPADPTVVPTVAMPNVIPPTPPKASVQSDATEAQSPAIVTAQIQQFAPLVPALEKKGGQIASPATRNSVQLALSNLEAVVKGLPAQAWAQIASHEPKQNGEKEPTSPLQDFKIASIAPFTPLAAPVAPLNASAAAPLQPAASLNPGELVMEQQLDMTHEGEWLDQLARDIVQTAGSDKNPLRFRLNPETLGTMRVEITQDRQGAAVRITTETEAARAIIADAQPRLIAEARAQGIRISEAHVDLGNHSQSGDPRRQNAVFQEEPLRTARSLQEHGEGDGNPTSGRSERYA